MLPLKSAVVQVAWLGVPFGATVPGVDFRFADALAQDGDAPEGTARPWPLAGGTHVYPWPFELGAEPLPAETNGHVSFGIDAGSGEINPEAAAAWSEALLAVPGSRLLLRDNRFGHSDAINRLIETFGDFGVAHRIEVVSASSRNEFLREIDVLLTPFPFTRPYAAAEALALGVPVVALSLAGAMCEDGACLVRRLGLAERGLAVTTADYVKAAVAWAADAAGRATFRREARSRFSASPAYDVAAFTRQLEDAYLGMWRAVTGH
ncbi:MAG: hypothetical protein A3J29_19245 [Acidobacteria bacterium RIFCSPLOWO2_12_FULL_67_14b]|nr:MAG: hypothetical protein A3J29_19245 [Acidobacteria bacterium RIFCSPLOWO2_12_FULL_67_14b]